jgi:hypothetical protein
MHGQQNIEHIERVDKELSSFFTSALAKLR